MSISGAAEIEIPGWIAAVLAPGRAEHASRIPWGFRNEVWRVRTADGRDLAVTRFLDTEAAASIVSLTARLGPRLDAIGVPTATVIDGGPASVGILVTEFVDGTVGAALMDEPGGPALAGSVLGATWRRLAALDPTGLDLDRTWVRPNEIAAMSRARVSRVGPLLGSAEDRQLDEGVARVEALPAGRRTSFVHGDLLPVNVIVRGGELAALLDFEFARLADPLLDAGWFDSIVAFHHPLEHRRAWDAFLAASGIDADERVTCDLLRILPMLRYLEILEDPGLRAEDVPHWISMLRAHLARS